MIVTVHFEFRSLTSFGCCLTKQPPEFGKLLRLEPIEDVVFRTRNKQLTAVNDRNTSFEDGGAR
jgi:hypothetical protein